MFILINSEKDEGVECNIIGIMSNISILPKLITDMIEELLNPLIRKNLEDGGKQRIKHSLLIGNMNGINRELLRSFKILELG